MRLDLCKKEMGQWEMEIWQCQSVKIYADYQGCVFRNPADWRSRILTWKTRSSISTTSSQYLMGHSDIGVTLVEIGGNTARRRQKQEAR